MMMYDMSRQYHAERIMSAAEQRRADEQLGRMAARTSQLWRRATRPARALRGLRACRCHNRRVTETTEAMLARVRASFDRQGMMSTLGVEVTSVEPGKVEMSLRHDDRFTQQHGFLHAGAVASVLDTACGFAAFSVMPPDAAVLTASYTINLIAPAGRGAVHDHRRGGPGGPHPGRLPRRGVRRRRPAPVRGHAGHHDRRLRQGRHQRLTAVER